MGAELDELVQRAAKVREVGALKRKLDDGSITAEEQDRLFALVLELDARGQETIRRRFDRAG